MNCLWFVAMVAACGVGAGQGADVLAAREFPTYKVYPGTLDEDNFPVSGARLCTTRDKANCFTLAHSGPGSDRDNWSYYGLRATSKRIKLDGGSSVVLFNANCGGGSGSADRYVLLRSEPDGHLKNLLPEIIATNQADVAMWNLPSVSPMPVLVMADSLWEAGAHYGDHFFEVRMYVYDPTTDKYKLRHRYRTGRKYPGVDNWESQPEVLNNERSRVIQMFGVQ